MELAEAGGAANGGGKAAAYGAENLAGLKVRFRLSKNIVSISCRVRCCGRVTVRVESLLLLRNAVRTTALIVYSACDIFKPPVYACSPEHLIVPLICAGEQRYFLLRCLLPSPSRILMVSLV